MAPGNVKDVVNYCGSENPDAMHLTFSKYDLQG